VSPTWRIVIDRGAVLISFKVFMEGVQAVKTNNRDSISKSAVFDTFWSILTSFIDFFCKINIANLPGDIGKPGV
jgi:hypothetical protein